MPEEPDTEKAAPDCRALTPRALTDFLGFASVAALIQFVGGAMMWIRFEKAELPADRAVSLVPLDDLFVIGASSLALPLGAGLLAGLFQFVFGRNNEAAPTFQLATGNTSERVSAARLELQKGLPRRMPKLVGVLAVIGLLVVGFFAGLTDGQRVCMAVATLVIAGGVLIAARPTVGFRAVFYLLFFSALLWGALVTVVKELDRPPTLELAVVVQKPSDPSRDDARALGGFLIARNDDGVYIARLVGGLRQRPQRPKAQVVEIPDAEVMRFRFGPERKVDEAAQQDADLLARQALRRHGEVTRADLAVPVSRIERSVPPDDALELARKFRPILLFDRDERWRPLSIEAYFSEAFPPGTERHRICPTRVGGLADCEDISGLPGFLGASARSLLGRGRHIDIVGSNRRGTDFRSPDLSLCGSPAAHDCDFGPASAIYYNVTKANDRYYVDYWWFLRFNAFPRFKSLTGCRRLKTLCSNHEGDWEGVTVITTPDKARDLEYVSYAAHDGVFRYTRDQATERESGQRPIVYVANGSHASYPRRCSRDCRQDFTLVGPFRRPEGRHDGTKAWGRNTGPECERGTNCLQPLPEIGTSPAASWNAWLGRWGKTCPESSKCQLGDGPKSPSQQPRFQEPWCFVGLERQLTCDVPTPEAGPLAAAGVASKADCRAWVGQQVAALACDPMHVAKALGPEGDDGTRGFKLSVGREVASASDAPGVAQLVRSPLKPGETLKLAGPTRASTILIVRAETRAGTLEVEYDKLRVPVGASFSGRVRSRGGSPVFELRRPDGAIVKPVATTVRRR